MTHILLPLGLAFIMLTIGLGLSWQDFALVFRRPRAMLVGLVGQMVLLPLIALVVLIGFEGHAEFALGVMLIAASPGGITSNLLTSLARGNAALSVSLTAITSLAGVITVPLILGGAQLLFLGRQSPLHMPLGMILGSVFLISALPILTGMGIRAGKPGLARRIQPWARKFSTAIFAVIVAGAFIGQMDVITQHFGQIGPRLLLLNLGTMALGLAAARLLRLATADGVAISLECGLQNAAMAIFIAISVLHSPMMVVPAITYALVMNVTATGFIAWRVRTGKRPTAFERADSP